MEVDWCRLQEYLWEVNIIIMSCHPHGYPRPFLAIFPYCSSPPAGLLDYISYLRIAAVCMFELVVLLLLDHKWGSIGVHHLWAHLCSSSSVLRAWFEHILNKSWWQHPTKHQLYGHLPPITKIIQVRRTRHEVNISRLNYFQNRKWVEQWYSCYIIAEGFFYAIIFHGLYFIFWFS